MRLEKPALIERETEVRKIITKARGEFIENVLNAHNDKYLDLGLLVSQLEVYEQAAQIAVEGNLQLINASLNDTSLQFPVQNEKWSIIQAIFFASTVCTTIGELCNCKFN